MAQTQKEPLIVQYTNLLHEYQAPNAPPVLQFFNEHKDDKVFAERSQKLSALYVVEKLRLPAG